MAATLDEAVDQLKRLVDLGKVANSIALASHALLRRAAFVQAPPAPRPVAEPPLGAGAPTAPPPTPASPQTYPVLPPVALPTTPAPVPAPVLATYPVLPPVQLPPRPPSSVPAAPPAAPPPGPAPTPHPTPKPGPWGRLWQRVKKTVMRRTGLGRVRTLSRKGRMLGRATGLPGGSTAGGLAGGATGLVLAFESLRRTTASLTDAQMAAARRYAEVSGSMAAVFAQKDVYDTLRAMRVGDATAGSAQVLMQSEARRKDAEAGIEIAATNIGNRLLAVLNDIIAPPLELAADFLESIDKVLKMAPWAKPEPPPAVGIAAIVPRLEAEVWEADRRAADLLAVVRAAGARIGGGVARPPGP